MFEQQETPHVSKYLFCFERAHIRATTVIFPTAMLNHSNSFDTALLPACRINKVSYYHKSAATALVNIKCRWNESDPSVHDCAPHAARQLGSFYFDE